MPEPIIARNFVRKADGTVEFDTLAGAGDTLVNFNESSPKLTTRLVHDGSQVIALFESDGITWTKNAMFCGTLAECDAEIAARKLKPLPDNETGLGTKPSEKITK